MSKKKILQTEREGRVFVILPTGEVGGFAGDQVSLEVDDVLAELDEYATRDVLVDLSNVTFFGSSLLGTVQKVWKHMTRLGGQMALCSLPEMGPEVLHVSRFDELWSVYPSREDAKAALLAGATKSAPDESLKS